MRSPDLRRRAVSRAEFSKQSRRSFITAGIGAILGVLGLYFVANSPEDRETPSVLRRANEKLARFWNKNFNLNSKVPPVDAYGKPVRINGDVGMLEEVDTEKYRLAVLDGKSASPILL